MAKKPDSEQDQSFFREAMRGVKPITISKITPEPSKPQVTRTKRQKLEQEPLMPDIFSDFESLPSLGREDTIEFSRPGLQNKILRNLRKGKYNIEAILDLHGQTVVEARTSLRYFLSNCHQNNKRHLLIIHGKGHGVNKPILKNKLNHWLRETELVLAFCSSSVRDGRGGSLYVLLKGRN